ncbi:MAG: DUF2791 family P-loop domain-containing protein [Kineosporiaceae bacterium]|nr:DUF2791 family P-loop domain-containing protein [Kineosporiaceae bacterium]
MFVGRPAELAQVDSLLDDAAEGRSSVLVVVGDPGSGRTALLQTAVLRARRRGMRAVCARVADPRPQRPLVLVHDLLRALGCPQVGSEGFPDESNSAADSLVANLSQWSGGHPGLVAIDELAWADRPSLLAVVEAVDRLAGHPVAVLASGRTRAGTTLPGEPAPATALDHWPATRLAPLDSHAAAAVVRSALGPRAAARTVSAIVAASDGNPAALVGTAGLLTSDEASGVAALPDPLPLPRALRVSWTTGLDAYPPATLEALRILAVVRPSSFDLVECLLSDAGADATVLDPAIDSGVLQPTSGGVPAFSRPLVMAAITAETPPDQRRALHRRAADVAARLELPPHLVVGHLIASTGRPDAEIADSLELQAERARRREDGACAAEAQVWAARLTPSAEHRRRRVLHAIRDRLVYLPDPGDIAPIIELLGPDPVPADQAGWITWLHASAESDLAVATAEQQVAIAEARAHAPGLLPSLLWDAIGLAWARGDPAAAMATIDELDQVARSGIRSERSEPPWLALTLRAAGLFQLGRVSESIPLRADASRRADHLDPAACELDTLLDAVELDDDLLLDTAGSRTRLAVALRRCSHPVGPMTACLWGISAWQARARGDWLSAMLLIHDGLALCSECAATRPLDGLLALSVELAALQGDRDRLGRHGAALRSLALGFGDRRRLATLDRAEGMAALAEGALDKAAALLALAGDVPFLGRGTRDAVLPSRVDLVEVNQRLGRHDEARIRSEALHPVLQAMDQPLARAWDERVSALCRAGEPAAADTHYGAALSAHADTTDRFEEARTELLYGEHLRRTRRRAEARRHLTRAETLFGDLRALPWLERTRGELRVAGSARAPLPTQAPGLTPQEATIAAAVSRGRSTREVAELLVLSPRTVETHLSNIYRKLGLTGRAGLASALEARGT